MTAPQKAGWLCLLIVGLVLSACQTPKQAEYKTLAAIGLSVETAMSATADAYVAGEITDAEWARVSAAHRKFLLAYNRALDVAQVDLNAASPEQLKTMWREMLATIQEVTK